MTPTPPDDVHTDSQPPGAGAPVSLRSLLRPVHDSPDDLVRPEHVGGRAAFWDLVRRGALVVVREEIGFRPGRVVGSSVRARSLAELVPPGTVVAGRAACWVHAGGHPPQRIELLCPAGTRVPPTRSDRSARYASLLRPDVVDLAGVPVTSPLRTALDLASSPAVPARAGATLTDPTPESVVDAVRLVTRLCDATGLAPAGVRRALELKHRWRGRPVARDVLDAVVDTVADRGRTADGHAAVA